MALLMPDQIADTINLIQKNYDKKKWVDISMPLQSYEFASRLFQQKGRIPEKGGTHLNWKIQTANLGNAKHSALWAIDNTGVKDLTQECEVPWSKQTTNFSYDIHEKLFHSDKTTIVEELKVRAHSMYNDYFTLMEEALWSTPTSSTQDPRPPLGIPHWVIKDATTTPAGGLEGGDPSGFSAGAGGLSSATFDQWDNWAFGYTNVTRDDLMSKVRVACYNTSFEAPHKFPDLTGGDDRRQNRWVHYTTYAVREPLERLAEDRNDNLGSDAMRYYGMVLINGNPLRAVPYLDANDSTDPWYGIDWSNLKYVYQRGAYMQKHPPQTNSDAHTVRDVFMDCWGQFKCLNRRSMFVGSTS
jgi:hypothetical protein